MGQGLQCLLPSDHVPELISLYQEHRENCVFHLHQEFAFVLFDRDKQTIFAARDRIGLKPLYYAFHAGRYYFSSDLGTLFAESGIEKKANHVAMEGIVQRRTVPYAETMYQGVKRLPPGHTMTISAQGDCELVRYWKPEEIQINREITREQAAAEFRRLFDQAIADCIEDPSSTACELSGGLDSSSVVSWIKHQYPKRKLTCFSLTFDSLNNCQETEYIDEMDRCFEIDLVKLATDTLDYKNQFNLEYNYALNPFWPIFITYTMGFPLVERARELGVKTILTGQGGDHLTGGNLYSLHDYLRQWQWNLLVKELGAYDRKLGLVKRFILLPLLGGKGRDFVLKLRRPFRKASPGLAHNPAFYELADRYKGSSFAFRYDLSQLVDSHHSALYENSYYQVAEARYGIEFKHPFFDSRLIEFMLSMPPEYKLYRGVHKHLLRVAMKGILPENIRRRADKARFNEVLRQQIDAVDLDEFLADARIAKLGLIDQHALDEAKQKYRAGKLKAVVYFWQVLNLEYWYRYNFEGLGRS